ncbi:MAG: hypothetical protein LBU83_12200, partial [Bacteroidales bacterium]|nr:hypothetical protein [Bacteroidales bacterium]
ASNYHEFEPLEVKGDPPTRAPNPFRRILSGIVSLFSSSEKRENARLVDAEAYNRLMNIEYNIDNYELYLHFYLEAFTGVFTDTINYESIKQELSNIQRDCPDEAAKAGLELLTRISKKTGLEHSATIVKMGDNSYHLRNFRVGTQTNVIIPGINTPEVVNEFGQLTPDNVAGYIHTHVPVRGGKRTSFSLQDFETSYGKRRPIYLRYTGDTRGRVFRLTPPNSNAHRVQMRVAIIRNNEHKLPSFLRSERLVSEIK